MNYKLLSVFGVLFLLVGGVYALSINYSEPTKEDGLAIEWKEAQQPLTKTLITKEEYNQIFEDYRNGILTKQEASQKLRSSKW